MLTYEYLLSILHYDPNTGEWIWKTNKSKRAKKGMTAGSINGHGHRIITINNKSYYAHILAWFYMKKEWPKKDIDHADTNPNNNIWTNLREATESQNLANAKINIKNTSGYKGVSWCNYNKKWKSRITKNDKRHFIGHFNNPIDAAIAYDKKAIELFGDFANLNFKKAS